MEGGFFMPRITKIVITGGPCGGKSTGLSRIEKHFSGLGYHVMFVNETATEMITGGAVPWMGITFIPKPPKSAYRTLSELKQSGDSLKRSISHY
jgi:predicted ATPase